MSSTPNMGLQQPTAGVDSGITWESAVNNNSNTIDQHTHTPGNGVPIPVTGISIQAALSFNNSPATALQAAVFNAQPSLATMNAIYVIGSDLYYNDGSNPPIRITAGGSVNVTSSGITNGSATASFNAGVLVVNSAATVPANIQVGSVLLGNNVANSKFLTLAPPAAMASNISQTLPTIPASTSIMQMDSSGNMSAVLTADGTTIVIGSNQLSIASGGVGTTQLATGAVTTAKLATDAVTTVKITDANVTPAKISASNNQTSSLVASFSTATGSFQNITGLAVTITTSGRPVMLLTQCGTSQGNYASTTTVVGANAGLGIALTRNASMIFRTSFLGPTASGTPKNVLDFPASSMMYIDYPTAGTYTYQVQLSSNGASATASIANLILTAVEIF